ncbi:MAG: serine protein kinase [Halobacteriovorax sp.]|nr:serine protein kinase [Halobacteriovorax sp.]|tara:strand:- start:26141 stop:28069 length:1929 start_codon:yes stop_codon:yes gene_type:complete
MTDKKKFLNLIQKQRDTNQEEKFRGTFLEYLDLVQKNPDIIRLAHKRLYDAIANKGSGVMSDISRNHKLFDGENIQVYDYFDSEFFGMERVIAKLMRFLKSASLKGEESRQILLLMGPVGAGKSALTEHIKAALEGEKYYCLEGDPQCGEPLHLVPRGLRKEFEKILKVKIEGDLSPVARHKLLEDHDGQYENFPVVERTFSARARRGIASVPPMDANSQDVSVLIGSEDISKLDLFPEDDPRVLSLNGAFNVGNRGIVELIEVFKNEIEFLHTVITATQEKRIPSPGKNAMIHFDGVILAHCNEAEWNRFRAEHTNEAILDRIVKINVPYVLELDQEIKIYEKLLSRSDFKAHIAPHTLKVASMFSVLSRLKASAKCDILTKMKIYNGEDVIEKGRVKKIDIKDLKDEAAPREGMEGISTRFIMKSIDNALSDAEKSMITPVSILKSLTRQVKDQIIREDFKDSCLEILQGVREEYLKILETEIAKAFVTAYEEQAQALFDTYLDNAEAFTTRQRVKDGITKEEREPDEEFMRSIEEQIGIIGSSRDGFRSDVTAYMFARMRRGDIVDYRSYEPLKEAIEGYLITSVKDMARIVTKSKTRDDDQQKRYGDMVSTMIEEYGYSEDSAEEILRYASNNLWRDG